MSDPDASQGNCSDLPLPAGVLRGESPRTSRRWRLFFVQRYCRIPVLMLCALLASKSRIELTSWIHIGRDSPRRVLGSFA